MHSIKTRIIALLTVAVITGLVLAVAFSGWEIKFPEEDEPVEDSGYIIGKDTVHLWYTDESLTDYLNYVAVGYSESHDDIRVVPVLVSGREYIESISEASMSDEELPDLFITTNDMLEKAHLAGLAEQIQPTDSVDITQKFPEVAIDSVTYNGEMVAYPMFMECSALCYNRTYLEQWARTTLESEIRAQMAEEAKEKETEEKEKEKESESDSKSEDKKTDDKKSDEKTDADKSGDSEEEESKEPEVDPVSEMVSDEDVQKYVDENLPYTLDDLLALSDNYDAPEKVETIFKWTVTDIFYNYFFIGDSVNVGGPRGDDPNVIDIYNEEAIKGLTEYQKLNQFFSINTDDVSYSGVIEDFETGSIVMTIVTSDAVRTLKQAKEEGHIEYDYRFLPLPDISESHPARSMSVTDVIAVNGYSSMKQAANDFACYLCTQDALTLYEWTGKVSAQKDADFGEDGEAISVFVYEYVRSVPLPKMLVTSNYWVKLEMLFASVWNGDDANAGLKALSEQMKLQATGEEIREETIVIPEEIVEEDEIIEEEAETET